MAERFRFHSEPSQPELKMKSILDSMALTYSYQLATRSGYVLDFAFREEMKAIEIDGYFHKFRREKDAYRDAILRRGGWRILRIKAAEMDSPSVVQSKVREFLAQ